MKKQPPKVLFYGASGRIFMLFGVLPDSNNAKQCRPPSASSSAEGGIGLCYAYLLMVGKTLVKRRQKAGRSKSGFLYARLPPFLIPFRGLFFVWPPLGTFRAVRLTCRTPVFMRRTEGKANAEAEATDRRRIAAPFGDTAVRSTVVPAAAAPHAVGAFTGPFRVGLR